MRTLHSGFPRTKSLVPSMGSIIQRRPLFDSFRDPSSNAFEPLKWPPLYGDAFGSFDSPPGPRVGFAVTPTIYKFLQDWMEGNFIGDFDPAAREPLRSETLLWRINLPRWTARLHTSAWEGRFIPVAR